MSRPHRFALASRRILLPHGMQRGAVVVAGETIQAVVNHDDVPADLPVVPLGDLVLSPGLIDTHVHINEPGRTEWEGFASATRAAAAGGVTTLVDMPLNSSPVTTDAASLYKKQEAAAGQCSVDVGFYGGLVPANLDSMAELIEQGVFGIKTFLCDSGLAEFPATPLATVEQAMQQLAKVEGLLLVHAELPPEDASQLQPAASLAELAAARSDWEQRAVLELIACARRTGCRTHIVHVSTAEAIRSIADAKAAGVPITAETCPHYLSFCLDDLSENDQRDPRYKCMPPIGNRPNREQLWEAVLHGLFDTIGSDHSPCPPALKEAPFAEAWGGIAALELTLPAVWTGLADRGLRVDWTARLLAEQPARLIGLDGQKGRIAPGLDADFCVWDPDAEFTVDGPSLEQRSPITPYAGRQLRGRVQQTFLRGELVYDRGKISGPPRGRRLQRQPGTRSAARSLHRSQQASRVAAYFNALDDASSRERFEWCCAARRWVEGMQRRRPFASDDEVFRAARDVAETLAEEDWLEAFAAHPQIGDVTSLREKYASTASTAAEEQQGAQSASDATLEALAEKNQRYLARHGFLFIVCATGKSADEMLQLLAERLDKSREQELQTAAEEQLKITELRLRKAPG